MLSSNNTFDSSAALSFFSVSLLSSFWDSSASLLSSAALLSPVEDSSAFWEALLFPAPEQPPDTPDHFFLDPYRLTGPLVVRPRLTGDTITLPRRRAKTVKKLLIDAKVPRWDRDRLPLLADASGPLWLAGFGPDQGRLSSSGAPALEVIALRTAPAEELQNE